MLQLRWMTWALQDPAAGPADAAAEPDFTRANGSSHAAPHRAGSGPSEGSWVSEVGGTAAQLRQAMLFLRLRYHLLISVAQIDCRVLGNPCWVIIWRWGLLHMAALEPWLELSTTPSPHLHRFPLNLGLSPPPCWQVLVPALLDLETQLFGEMLRILWWGVLLPTGQS